MIEVVFKSEKPGKYKTCYDCRYCKGAINWHCTNREAQGYTGGIIIPPARKDCPFWEACVYLPEITKKEAIRLYLNKCIFDKNIMII